MRKEILATILGQLLIEQVSCAHDPATALDCLDTILSEKYPELSAFHKDRLADILDSAMAAIYRIDHEYNPSAVHDDKYTAVYDYDEDATLQRLESNVTALTHTVAEQSEQLEDYDPATNTFLMIVNDQPHEFIAGGPQLQALHSFIENMI